MPGLLYVVEKAKVEHNNSNETTTTVPLHPIGVRPAGNAYTSTNNVKDSAGLFSFLPDEFIMSVMEYLEVTELLKVGSTCKALYAFSRFDELWKTLFIASDPSADHVRWHGNWYFSYRRISSPNRANISCNDLFSDVLHRPFLCAHTPLHPYSRNIPLQNRISRLANLSPTEFTETWTDRPFILMEPVKDWSIYKSWDQDYLRAIYGKVAFRAEAVEWQLRAYLDYMNETSDESPLYLFDHSFVEKMKITVGPNGAYRLPECFGEDLFATLGNNRPDCRWLIIGPERGGSTFHKDPNATSAWNAVIRGSKYWIMFPTSPTCSPPPGVYVSEDQSEVTSPLSISEWLLEYHAEARATHGCVEGICHEGEVLHVPSGWWHLVVNLDSSIAVTQNFVPQAHLAEVLSFLKNKPDQVSGFKKHIVDPYGLFVQKLEEEHSELLAQALEQMERVQEKRKRKWDELVNDDDEQRPQGYENKGFSFGFGEAEDLDVP